MTKKPKILYWDIESSYVKANIWRYGEQYVSHDQIARGQVTKIICIGYKWEHEKKAHVIEWDNKKQDSKQAIKKFIKILETADLAIAHNGNKFDMKVLNAQAILNGLPPINWPATDDSLLLARRHFSFPSYRLDYLAKTFLGEGKNPMSFIDWELILEGETQKIRDKALRKMVRYCKKDVVVLQGVVEAIRAYTNSSVNRSIIINGHREGCPSCGSSSVQSNGFRTTKAGRYRRLRCNSCGHGFKSHKMEKNNARGL